MASYDEDIDTIPRKLSFIGSSPEDQMAAGAQLIVDYHPSSSPPPIASQSINSDENNPKIFQIRKIYKNLIVISVAFTFMLTAYTSILSLQSSLNVKNNIGVNSLFIIYAGTIFSAIFFTGSIIDIFGHKWTMIIGLFAYLLYTLANFYPTPALLYTSAGLVGLGAAPLWTAEALYVNRIGRYHAQHKRQLAETSVTLFFGIFSTFQGTSAVWGNLISYFVLNQSNNPQKVNCGIYFDPKTVKPMNHSGGNDVDEATRYLLFGIFSGITVLSMVLLFLMLNHIQLAKKQSIRQSMKKSVDVLLSMIQCKHIDQLFLIPITIWTLVQSTFLTAQFTRAFITCLIGIRYIGLVLLVHGITYMISSYIFGLLARYIGRIGCFVSAAVFNYAMIVWMYFWEPNDQQIIVLYIISGVWGISDAIWQSQLIAAYTILYSDSDPTTVAKYRLWKSVGSLLTYSYASYITISLTLFILTIFLTVSMICYGFVEIHVRWKNRGKEQYIAVD
ncbi:unnamed protein product [Adineta steineri]|uniref:UNC93-like protein n=2 Tax=Adineta steineri TaxID=433720 RepID=A0A819CYW6_9BILA|nr:unnamed protein product [Adineta steineri]CAF3825888.1 unnamed protein product [Adineta steineri]